MSSVRHKSASVVGTPEDRYLDAAREAILAVGWSRTTLTDIARRAGVSRMTLYRRWPDTRSLLADLMTREWSITLGAVLEQTDDEDPLRHIVDAVGGTVRALRRNELMQRILELDPELVLPYLLQRRGRSQDLLADVLAGQIRNGQQDGVIRAGRPTMLARTLLLMSHGFTLSAHTMGRPGDYDRELRVLVERYLAP